MRPCRASTSPADPLAREASPLPRLMKSNNSRSASCEGETLAMARKMFSMRPGCCALPLRQHFLDGLALQVVLRPAQVAGNERELPHIGVAGDVLLAAIGQRPDHDVLAVVGQQLGRHGLQSAAVEQVEEQRLDDVVAVMAQCDPRDAMVARRSCTARRGAAGNTIRRSSCPPG